MKAIQEIYYQLIIKLRDFIKNHVYYFIVLLLCLVIELTIININNANEINKLQKQVNKISFEIRYQEFVQEDNINQDK